MVSLDCTLLNFSNNDLIYPIFEGSGSNFKYITMVFSAEMSKSSLLPSISTITMFIYEGLLIFFKCSNKIDFLLIG